LETTPFKFDLVDVRVICGRDSAPWFVAADVCSALGIANPSDALRRLDDDERMTLAITEGHSGRRGGAQSLGFINESGLYSLILTSRKSNAKRFKKWVTAEVLPSIRKTGAYITQPGQSLVFNVPKTMSEALRLAADMADRIQIMEPKAEAHDRIASASGEQSLQVVAKMYGIGPVKIFEWLRERGILMQDNTPLQKYIESGYFRVKQGVYAVNGDRRCGDDKREQRVYSRTLLTGKGVLWISRLLTREGELDKAGCGTKAFDVKNVIRLLSERTDHNPNRADATPETTELMSIH